MIPTVSLESTDHKGGVRDAAEGLRTLGLAICKIGPNTKKPANRGWTTCSLEASDFNPNDLIGIVGGPLSNYGEVDHALVVIDLDHSEAVRRADEFLPPTGMVEGRPGKPRSHRYYLMRTGTIPDWAVSTAPQAATAAKKATGHAGPFTTSFKHDMNGTEVLKLIGTGGQVVCPPSAHPCGEFREWVGGKPDKPALVNFDAFWASVCRLAYVCRCKQPKGLKWPWGENTLPTPVKTAQLSATPAIRSETDANVVARAEEYLRKIPPAVSGSGGHDRTFAAARAVVWGFDLGADRGFDVLKAHYNPRCSPPWSDEELRHKCHDADTQAFDKPRGYLRDSLSPADQTGGDPPTVKTPPGCPGKKPRPVADVLTSIATEAFNLWHDAKQVGYATCGRRTLRIRSRELRLWITRQFRERTGKTPNAESLGNAITAIEAEAIYADGEGVVHVRIAGHDGRVYLHLADAADTVIEVTADGWRTCDDPPVRFRRMSGMLPLPLPVRGGVIDDLRLFLNCPDDDAFALVKAWITAAFRPDGPFPLLALLGEQGTAKTTTALVLKRLLDPGEAPVRSEPKDIRDLMIATKGNWLLAFDNLSHLPPWLSDSLCRLATGGGFATRELYSDEGEVIFNAKRPVILNGIEDFITRADLLERAILLRHPPISEANRRTESEFWAGFDSMHPRLLGAILDRVAAGLRELPAVSRDCLPRTADFAIFAIACESGAGENQRFLAAYGDNQTGTHELALEATPILTPLVSFMSPREDWEGTATELLELLTMQLPTQSTANGDRPICPSKWPKRPNELGNVLRRIAPNLRHVHSLDVDCDRSNRGRRIRIRRPPDNAGETSSLSSWSSPDQEIHDDGHDDNGAVSRPTSSRCRHHQSRKTPAIQAVGDDGDDHDDESRASSGGTDPATTLQVAEQ